MNLKPRLASWPNASATRPRFPQLQRYPEFRHDWPPDSTDELEPGHEPAARSRVAGDVDLDAVVRGAPVRRLGIADGGVDRDTSWSSDSPAHFASSALRWNAGVTW